MITEEIQLQSSAAGLLSAWLHLPQAPAKGVVVFVHGLGEHAGRYQQLARWCTAAGYAVWVYDQQGHGRSGGKRGHAIYPDLLTDVLQVLQLARQRMPELPLYLYGHSMGGNLALAALLQYPDYQKEVKGIILASAWIKLAFKLLPLMVVGARLVGSVAPQFINKNHLKLHWLSRDAAVGAAYAADPLVHKQISVGLFYETHRAGLQLLERVHTLQVPMLVMHGAEDVVTCPKTSQKLAKAAGMQAEFIEWPRLRHELHNEPEGEAVINRVFAWISKT